MTATVSATQIIQKIVENIRLVIKGKDVQINQAMTCWLAGGHLLLEDVPGTGKTMLARAMALTVQGDFKRIQMTPDLLPSDLLGTSVFNRQQNKFDLIRGPIFSSLLLADEINRATPRTQSALLEAMAEGQVSIDGTTQKLSPQFFVIATQNPIEQQGTFPLPEAQLDRFTMKMSLGYPDFANELEIFQAQKKEHPIAQLKAVASQAELAALQKLAQSIHIEDSLLKYALKIVEHTRKHAKVKVGASPRAFLQYVRAAQAAALMEGKGFVTPTHFYRLAAPVLAHRICLTQEALFDGSTPEQLIEMILQEIQAPVFQHEKAS